MIDFDANFGWKGELLISHLDNHLDWGNRDPTPFISAYTDWTTAEKEALRRIRQGKQHVTITEIDVRKVRGKAQYRHVRGLARRLDYRIPYEAWPNSKYEYVFLHQIPESAIVRRIRV